MTAIINDEASRVRTQVQSQPGRALTFDGVNDYVLFGSAVIPNTADFSICFWMNSSGSVSSCVISQYVGGDAERWGINANLSGNISWFSGGSFSALTTSGTTNSWQHVVVQRSGTAVTVYINGCLDLSITNGNGIKNTPTVLGSFGFPAREPYGGKLHDFRIYDRILTATEICNLYNATKQSGGDIAGTLYAANLVGWWPLEEINISSIRDASGNDYHGTESGTVTLYTGADVPCSIKNELGYTLDAGEEYYALASDLTKDIQDDPLGYPGPLAKRALPKASPCATFDGLNDRADAYGATDICVYDGVSSFTATAWIRNTNAGWRAIVTKTLDSSGTTRNWGLFIGPSYQLSLWAGTNSVCEGGVVSNSAWVHVAAVVSGTTGTLYINGVQVATGARSAPGTGLTSQICIASEAGSLAPLQGRIVDVRLFDRALSVSEINSVMAGNNVTSGLASHWPCTEKSLKLLNDISGNGNNALATGMTSGELWANTQDVYHAGLTAGVRTTNGRRGYRYFNGSNQYFTAQDASSPAVGGDIPFFVSACVRTATIGAGAGVIASKFDGGSNAKSFMLYRSGADLYFGISSNGTTVTEVSIASALTAGSIARILAYHDPVANTIGLSVNGGAFTTAAYSSGIYNASSSMKVGAAETASYPWAGDMFYVGIALPASVPSWTAVRDALTQGLTYADLTPTQISDWGVTAWYDCDEWGPQLRDKHSDNHLTGANYSTDYSVPAVPALLDAPTHEYGTFSKELAGAFNGGHDAKYACTTGQKLWVAAMVRINHYSTAGDGIVSKYSSSTEWSLHVAFSTNNRVYFLAYDSANALKAAVATSTPINDWMFVFAYIDATTAMSLGISIDGGSFATDSSANGPRSGTDSFQIGNLISTNYLHGDIEYVAIGKAPLVSFSDVRDMLYSGGVPLRFGDLTAAQKTTIGLGEWFDVGEYDGSLTLTGKHAASALTGFCIPSAITHGGPKKLPAIDTAIDFTGGVAAPWTDKQYLGYLTCSGSAAGRVVTAALVGEITTAMSVYVRIRSMPTNTTRSFLALDDGAGGSMVVAIFDQVNGGKLAWYTVTAGFLDYGPVVNTEMVDGEWHDILFTWSGDVMSIYMDNVLLGSSATETLAAKSSAWTRAVVLANPDTSSNKFSGDIARLIVADGVRVPGNITTAPNLLDLRFDSPNCEDEQGRIPSSAWLSGHTPAKITVPTAYKHGVILPEGMVKTADELSERQFKLYKQDQ